MTRAIVTVGVCAALLCARTAPALPTAQQSCDNARITAWKLYAACVDMVVAKDAKGVTFDEFAAFARCRHTYFKKWSGFQTKSALVSSTCRPTGGARFDATAANGTVTDNLTGLVWEKKDALGGGSDFANPHDADNYYSWSTGSPLAENGTAYTSFLADLNQSSSGTCSGTTPPSQACTSDTDCTGNGLCITGFAGANGWRVPTLAELQTIVLDFPCSGAGMGAKCTCPVTFPVPCVDPALDAANTQASFHWSATNYLPNASSTWYVDFFSGVVSNFSASSFFYTRAVRGGL